MFNKSNSRAVALLAILMVGSAAMADTALPAGATDLFTTAAAQFALVLAAAFTTMVAITGGWIVFDMVKKGAKKASK